jgi:hypothetical protein
MLKRIIFLLIICFGLGLYMQASAQEKSYPQNDFFLYLGVRNSGADPLAGPRVERILFSSAHVDVKSGKIMADRSIPISFTKGNQDFNGMADLKMAGDYDKSDGQLSGTFSIKLDMKDVWHGSESDVNSDWVDDINGTFIGQVVDDKVVMRYKGKNNEEAHLGMALGKVRNESNSNDYNSVVVWRLSDYQAPETTKVSDLDKEFLDENGKSVDSGARFSRRDGQIEIHIPGTPEDSWHVADVDTVIPFGAQIKTSEDSSAVICFPDMSTATLKPETTVIMSVRPGQESKLKLVVGNIWLNIKKMAKDGTMEVDMFQAVAGIKGTTLVATAESDKAIFKVIEGKISVTALTDNQTVDIIGGQSATVDNAGKIVTEPFDIIAEQDTWDNAPQIDFAALEKSLPSEQAAVLASDSSAPIATDSKNQNNTMYIAIAIGIIFVGFIFALIIKRKKWIKRN